MSKADNALAKYNEIMTLKDGDMVQLDLPSEFGWDIHIMTVFPMSDELKPWRYANGTKIRVTVEPNREGFNGVAATPSGELFRVLVTPELWPFLTVLESDEKEEEKRKMKIEEGERREWREEDDQQDNDDALGNPDHGDANHGGGSPSGDQDQGEGELAYPDPHERFTWTR